MNGHLVTVEVGVECRADHRVNLDCLALNENWLERLDTQAVERRCAVKQHRVLVDDLFKYVPDLWDLGLNHLLGRLDVLCSTTLNELGHDERLEQLDRDQLRQTTLVEPQ